MKLSSNHEAVAQRSSLCLNAFRKTQPRQVLNSEEINCWKGCRILRERSESERSVGVLAGRGLAAKVRKMTGDGTPRVESVGQIPGSCEGSFGNSESELVGASEERPGRRHEFFPDRWRPKVRDREIEKPGDHIIRGWMLARRWASASFCDWAYLLRQAMVTMECTPEKLV